MYKPEAKSIMKKYRENDAFSALVDFLAKHMIDQGMTPTDGTEAVMCAVIESLQPGILKSEFGEAVLYAALMKREAE